MSNSDEDTSTKQVLNYYKNYSQSPHLPKYFSGSETVSFTILETKEERINIPCNIPKIVRIENSTKVIDLPPVKESSVDDIIVSPKFKTPQEECNKEICGRDGYMTRSNSLPTKLCQTEVQLDLSQISSTDNVRVLVFDSSTSSAQSNHKPEESHPIASSSSSSLTKPKSSSSSSSEDKRILSFGLTLSQLKEKIGVPIAFSTPTFALGEMILTGSDKESAGSPSTIPSAHKDNLSVVQDSVNRQNQQETFEIDQECTGSNPENIFSQIPDSMYLRKHMKSKRNGFKDKRKDKAVKIIANNHDDYIDSTPKVNVKPDKSSKRLVLSSVEEEDLMSNYAMEKTGKLSDNFIGSNNGQKRKTVELSRCEPISVDCLCADKAEIAVQTDQRHSHTMSNSVEGSSCDSFEYISSNVDSSKKTDRTENGKHESTISSKDGDFDKLIDVLQILLVTNKKKSSSKKERVKTIIKKLLSGSESDQQMSSSSSPGNKRNVSRLDRVKLSRRSDSTRETCSQSSRNSTANGGDYLLKFAENERLYQIAWIDNEIGHLSKLKKFLETNKGERRRPKSEERKQFRYKVVGADQGTNDAPQREYVIETDMTVPVDANINYVIDGKHFTVDPPESPTRDVHTPVFADIAVESKPTSTNIRISTLCSQCKQPICTCQVNPSIDQKKEDTPVLTQDAPLADMNSLEKAFHHCDCKTEHSDDTCPLVQKLAKHFTRYNTEKVTSNVCVQVTAPETVSKETQVMWENQNHEADSVYVPETEHDREITSLTGMPSSERSVKASTLQREKAMTSLRVQTEEHQPEKMTKEVQARVETLDRQVQYLKTLLKRRENGANGVKYQDSSTKTHDSKITDVQPPRSDCLSKMIQTETKTCSCGQSEPEIQGGLDRELKQVNKEVLVEHRSTSDQMIQTENRTNNNDTHDLPSATSATYSQLGSTSLSVPTSILDGQAPQADTCACCGRLFPREESADNKPKSNVVMCCCKKYALAYCTNPLMKCYCNGRSCKRNNYYCICDKNQSHKYKTYCKRCKKKLLDSMKQQRQGMAYTLILEENPNQLEGNEGGDKPRRYDEEVKVQIPKKQSSKKSKDRRNSYERNKLDRQGKQETKKETVQNSGDATVDNQRQYTLQEYLIENKPEFIYTAEYRRQLMLHSRIIREHNKDALKMHYLENRAPQKNGTLKLYSEQQMKEITKRNYEKLPEVRQKHVNKHKRCLKEADKVICERFARKIQRSVLKGKSNFPIDKNVINI